MATIVRQVDYFKVTIPNRPGAGARALKPFKDAGVNLLAVHAFPAGRKGAQLDFVPENTRAFKAAARKAKLKLGPRKTAFLVEGDDRAGAVAAILERLAAARVNVKAIDAVRAGRGRYGALLWVNPAQVRRARRALRAR